MQKNFLSSQVKHQRIISVQLAFFLIQRYCWTNSSSLYFSPICIWESKHSCNSPDSPIQNLSQLPLHVQKTGCQEPISICSLFSWSMQYLYVYVDKATVLEVKMQSLARSHHGWRNMLESLFILEMGTYHFPAVAEKSAKTIQIEEEKKEKKILNM